MNRLPWWLWPNVLSLDAPAIALVWQQAFARAFGVPLVPAERIVLFLTVWTVYAADRVADGLRLGIADNSSPRHRFAFIHRRAFGVLVVVALGTIAALIGSLPRRTILAGLFLAALVGVYFVWNQLAGARFGRGWAKEALVGILFAGGCALAPWMAAPSLARLFPILLFALVCLANCLLISRMERDRDITRGEVSLAVRLPPQLRPARIAAAAAAVAALVPMVVSPHPALHVSLAIAAAGIWCGAFVEARFGPVAAAAWADLVLLSPLVCLAM